MNRTILKYGVFVILFVMSLGLLIILNRFEVYSKAPVNLIVQEGEICIVYITYNNDLNLNIGDTIEITQTLGGNIYFILQSINKEPYNLRIGLYPVDKKMKIQEKLGGNTFSSGYIFTGRLKLRELIIRQFKE
jgi:hypothetical protein